MNSEQRRLLQLTVDDGGAGYWDYDARFEESLTPSERQRLADLVRRLLGSLGHDVRAGGIASPPPAPANEPAVTAASTLQFR